MDENETKTEGATDTNDTTVEAETVSVPKSDYDKLNQTLGSLKRELKDLKKPKEETKETKETSAKPDSNLIEKAFLRSAQITDKEEVELALSTAKKWGVSVDTLVDDEDFKVKLDKLRTNKANIAATSDIRGSGGTSQAKMTTEYWKAKGTRPTPADIPDRKTRVKVIRDLMAGSKSGAKFYNE
jgi:hypothetical protein